MKLAVPFSKILFVPLGITSAASAASANKEMDAILKIDQILKDSNVLLKGITKTIENETKGQKGGFLGISLGTLVASLLGNMQTGKGMLRAGYGSKDLQSKEGKGILRASYGEKNNYVYPILSQNLKYRSITKMNLDLMDFILEIICLKK